MFSDIEPGDIVLARKSGNCNSRYAMRFLVPKEVIKVTKKQFTTADGRYKKEDGCSIPYGDFCEPYSEEKDQSVALAAYNELHKNIRTINSAMHFFGTMRVTEEEENLEEIKKQALVLYDLIKGLKK